MFGINDEIEEMEREKEVEEMRLRGRKRDWKLKFLNNYSGELNGSDFKK